VLLTRLANYLKSRPDDGRIHVVRQSAADEDVSVTDQEPVISSAELIEGDALCAINVGGTKQPGFSFFLDGIERRHLLYYDGMTPVVYGFTAAVIRERRDDRRMYTFDSLSREKLYCPCAQVDIEGLQNAAVELSDTLSNSEADKSAAEHPLKLLDLARRAVSKDREKLERILAESWIDKTSDSDRWLLWDGSITVGFDAYRHPRVIGVIKSHQTHYFQGEQQRRIMDLKVGERSSVFMPKGRERTPVYSWYLRLHPNDGRDVYFGLVRIEAAASAETLGIVDEVSRWLLGERSPLSLPDGRWDRMIYPIRDCEQYLKSIAPSRTLIEAALSAL